MRRTRVTAESEEKSMFQMPSLSLYLYDGTVQSAQSTDHLPGTHTPLCHLIGYATSMALVVFPETDDAESAEAGLATGLPC